MDFKEEQKVPPSEFRKDSFERYVLTADVGGTNSNFAVFGVKDSGVEPIVLLHFSSQDITDFKDPVNASLEHAKKTYDIEIRDACFGVAGPIYEGRQLARLTNLDWDIDVRKLKDSTMLEHMILINDFEAIGFGIDVLPAEHIEELPHSDGSLPPKNPKETKAVIGAGTGLGEGILYYNHSKKGYVPLPSEGGHCDVAARTALQSELVKFLIGHDLCNGAEYPDAEDVVSGRGLVSIFKFLTARERADVPESIVQRLEQSDDKAATIAQISSEGDPACKESMRLFFELYGQEAVSLALKTKSLGGLYIAGGIAAKNLEALKQGDFMKAFDAAKGPKHPLHELVTQVPVFIVTDYDVSLYGAANAAANFIDIY
jgi:glucokinase